MSPPKNERMKMMREADLPIPQKLLLILLNDYLGKNEWCFPSQSRMAADLRIGPRQVRRLIADLLDANVIETERVGRTNHYRILWSKLSAENPPPTDEQHRTSTSSIRQKHRTSTSCEQRTSTSCVEPKHRTSTSSVNNHTGINHQKNHRPRVSVSWDGRLKDQEFRTLDRSLIRFAEAVRKKRIQQTEANLIWFVAEWARISQGFRDGKITKPSGAFVTNLEKGSDYVLLKHEDVAREFLKRQRDKDLKPSATMTNFANIFNSPEAEEVSSRDVA